ncbi:MAG: response regulator [Candidatus Omnitrophica bacterium]|nr:response regulator [Candidatus Omnitrophota bacterium]MBU1997529.1 response regulator [Candidatus Omnitrophota bacterium]MBU4332875.1 response regulator [Candidatus Omnitrophota bacterium]
MAKVVRKILIVDDDPSMVKVLEKWLKMDGYVSIFARTGEDGFTKAKAEKPDLVLMDLMLPDINGVQVIRQIVNDPETKGIPIVCITVTMGVETDKGDEQIDVDGRLFRAFAKPLHQRKLLSVIRKEINIAVNKN